MPEKKTVGFIGGIDRRLDYPLLEHLISSLPDVQFRFIGRIMTPDCADILRKYKNVVLVGPKNVRELPAQVRDFSVGIIPFRRTEFLKTVYPLKLNEYLAAGVPVVTTNFAHLDDFKDVVRIAETAEQFKEFVLQEMAEDMPAKRARLAVAKANSWEHRAEEFSQMVTELEQETQSGAA